MSFNRVVSFIDKQKINTRKMIGIVGSKGVGKSTAASYMTSRYGCEERTFAGPLKYICSYMTGLPSEFFHDQKLKEVKVGHLNVTPRVLMQEMGESFRALSNKIPGITLEHDNWWIHKMCEEVRKVPIGTTVVVSDVRYEDECNFITANGGVLVYIDSSGRIECSGDKHLSEQSERLISNCKYMIDNSGDIENLHAQIDQIITIVENN